MPVDSLRDMARRVAVRNWQRIEDMGEMQYELARPILLKVENPERLHNIELNSKNIAGNTEELWLNFIKRDIPDWQQKIRYPSDPREWYRVYMKLKKKASKETSNAEATLKAALSGIQSKKEEATVEIVGAAKRAALWNSTEAPGPNRRVRTHYNYMSGKTGSKGAHKMTVMEKIRKEVGGSKKGVMNRPMHELKKKYNNGVVKAPPSFVEDLKRQKELQQSGQRPIAVPKAKAPAPWDMPHKSKVTAEAASGGDPYDFEKDRAARLKAIAAGKPVPPMRQPPPSAQARPAGSVTGNGLAGLTLDFLESDSSDELEVKPQPRKKRQRVEDNDDDELFGTGRQITKRSRVSDSESSNSGGSMRKRQRDEDDELFGTATKTSQTRRRPNDDKAVSPRPKMSRPSMQGNDEPSQEHLRTANYNPPQTTHLKPTSNIDPARKLLKPLDRDPRPRSNSPMRLTPTSSPRTQPAKKKHEAPNLFMRRK